MKRPCADSLKPALLLMPEAPYPAHGGGALRAASVLEYLVRRYTLDVIVFRQPGAKPEAHFPPAVARRAHFIDLPANARHLPGKIARNAGRLLRGVPPLIDRFAGFEDEIARFVEGSRYDLAVIEHFWCAPYWPVVAQVSRRTVCDLQNIESMLHERCGRTDAFPASAAHRLFRRACLRLEREWLPKFTHLLATSEEDAAVAREISPGANVIVYPNAIPSVPPPERNQEDAIVFSGNMEYHPNRSAVRYFRRRIWPLLRERWPRLRWRLVGRNAEAVAAYTSGDDRIEVTGPVEDAVWEIAAGKVAVVPLLAGSGTRLKIMEAWAARRAVVSTSIGAEGLGAVPGEHLLIADDPNEFADAVSSLLGDDARRSAIGAAGRGLMERKFTWEAAWNVLSL